MNLENMSKKQLIEVIEQLKSEVKDNLESKEVGQFGDLTHSAVSVEIGKDGTYNVVALQYSPQSGYGKVVSIEPYPKAPHMAVYNANKFLSENIILKQQQKQKGY